MGFLTKIEYDEKMADLKQLRINALNNVDSIKAILSQIDSIQSTVDADVAGAGTYYVAADATDVGTIRTEITAAVATIT
jgi:hypothetical protein